MLLVFIRSTDISVKPELTPATIPLPGEMARDEPEDVRFAEGAGIWLLSVPGLADVVLTVMPQAPSPPTPR